MSACQAIRKMTWKSCQEFTTPTRSDKMQFRNWMSGLKCNAVKAKGGSNPWLDASYVSRSLLKIQNLFSNKVFSWFRKALRI